VRQSHAAAGLDAGVRRRFEERAQAEGLLDIAIATMDSPVGNLLLAATKRGLVEIAFAHDGFDAALDELARKLSPRILEAPARLEAARRQLDEYFTGRRVDFELPLDRALMGPFARRVRGRSERIPYGSVSSYAEVARNIGAPRAARAVGNALAANPIAVVVPCHRVLRTGGALGGYGGGLDRKEWLLDLESAHSAG
jgi:methylated-DNA-[protein]-cysteine S-methyltransferase